MALHHSEETHQNLIARIPSATGREIPDWLKALEAGPSFLRFTDRVNWLRDEYGISHGHARAIVHEHGLRRARLNFS